MKQVISIKGAKEHNLKNISLDIPKNQLVVITGVSGSGKSSLAFDTIYAEGQRRYVESLSSYARQFLGIMNKPQVESIDGLSPAISIDQKSATHNPRSTVGTITEIFDYLRLLYARVGHPFCPKCNIEVTKRSLDEIVNLCMGQIKDDTRKNKTSPQKFVLTSPVVRERKGEFHDLFENLRAKGFTQVVVDGKSYDLDREEIDLIKTNKHSVQVKIDEYSCIFKDIKNEVYLSNVRSRVSASVEQALALSGGLVYLNDELYSESYACPKCGRSIPDLEPRLFSFNSPIGACPTCKGLGTVFKIDPDLILNPKLTINEGGILPFNRLVFHDTWYMRLIKHVAHDEGISLDTPISSIPQEKMKLLLYGTKKSYIVKGTNRFGNQTSIYEKYNGIIPDLEQRFFESSDDELEANKYVREEVCETCKGKRLKPEALFVFIKDKNIIDVSTISVAKLVPYFSKEIKTYLSSYEQEVAQAIIKEIITRLSFLESVGLSYLTIHRTAQTLSGGELQRIRLASQIGSGLSGVLYVLDEPSIGLHPKDVSALITTLKKLRDLGNTLIVVEHDPETILESDYMIELGPKAGQLGGKIIFQDTISNLKSDTKSLTGAYLNGKRKISYPKRDLITAKGTIKLEGATEHNLKKVNLNIPLGNLCVVTGVSGSGKSSLVVETLYPALKYYLDGRFQGNVGNFERLLGSQHLERVYLVDQSPIGRTPRSNPATYLGIFDDIREIYAQTVDAKARGFQKGRFSFNVKGGRCEKCQGAGVIRITMQFLPDVYVMCDICSGKRYNKETLEVRFKDKTIYDILQMTVDESLNFFQNHYSIFHKLSLLKEVGLSYIQLGQPATTFSGGEAQRIKIANELSRRDTGKTLYILDEPTTGLHMYDIEKLLYMLYQLVERGNTVIIIEHNLDVIKNCQYVIDLGPEGGDKGGEILYQGPIDEFKKLTKSYTAHYLRK